MSYSTDVLTMKLPLTKVNPKEVYSMYSTTKVPRKFKQHAGMDFISLK